MPGLSRYVCRMPRIFHRLFRLFPELPGKPVALLAMALAMGVVTSTVILAYRFFHPVVYRDMWYMLDLVGASFEGSLWGSLWAPWNYHRIFFPKLLYLFDLRVGGGRGAVLVTLNLVCQAAVALLFYISLRRQSGIDASGRRVMSAIAWASCFWLVQSGNMLWGFQIAWFLNGLAAALATCLVCGMSATPARKNGMLLVGAGACASVAAFSLANGLFIWGVLGILLGRMAVPWRLQAVWWACTVVVAWGAIPAGDGETTLGSFFLLRNIPYALTVLGNPVSRLHAEAGFVLGMLGVTAFLVFAAWFLSGRLRGPFFSFAFAQSSYIVLSAWAIAAGRGHHGVEHATSSRYYTVALLFWAILFALAWLATRSLRFRPILRSVLLLGVTIVFVAGQWASVPERKKRFLGADLSALALGAGVHRMAAEDYATLHTDSLTLSVGNDLLKRHRLSIYRDYWFHTHGMRLSEAYALDTGLAARAVYHATAVATEPGKSGFLIEGVMSPIAGTGKRPSAIVLVRAGRVVGFAGTRERGCSGCFSGFAAGTSSGGLELYGLAHENSREVRRLDAQVAVVPSRQQERAGHDRPSSGSSMAR